MTRIRLTSIGRSCTKCGVESEVTAPYSRFDKVTNESCQFPDYDLVQVRECDNCHENEYLYWHDTELEKKHLEETRELLYFKTKALVNWMTKDVFLQSILDGLLKDTSVSDMDALTIGAIVKRDNRKFDLFHQMEEKVFQFSEERVHSLFTKQEEDKMKEDIRKDIDRWIDDFLRWLETKHHNFSEAWFSTIRKELPKLE